LAAVGKDPGFTPLSLLELLKRRGRYHPEDFSRLYLAKPVELPSLKNIWLKALKDASHFVNSRPGSEIGCLYFSTKLRNFVVPAADKELSRSNIQPHHGRPGGVLPRFYQGDYLSDSKKSMRL
jgi:hypothetical protein